ncbi:MAG: lipoprotein insertase outer membrane protein LolB [Thiobacillus sp.]
MRRFAVIASLAWTLGGCASVSPPPQAAMRLPLADAWTLQGRLGVQTEGESLSGQIRWQHRGDADQVLLTSPLGQGVARIVRDPQGASLELPGQPVRRAADVDALTREALGYALPVAGLAWWVQARPDPLREAAVALGDDGRPARIVQDGWTIDYLQYGADARPRKLLVSRTGLEIRLVADSWQAAP